MAIFTKELIFERIKDSGFPFWSLGLVESFRNTANVMQYYGNDFTENDTNETKIEKSLQRLDNIVSSFPASTVFVIEIKNSKQANSSGILGPFQFSNSAQPQQPQQLQQEYKPLAGIPDGYIPKSMLDGLEERMQKDFENRIKAYEIESEAKRLKEQIERRERELEKKERELDELAKGYNSGVAKSADVLVEAGKKLLTMLIPINTNSNTTELGNVSSTIQDEKSKVIDDFAEYLYNNYTAEQIKQVHNNYIAYNNAIQQQLQNTNCTSADATHNE